MKLFNTKTVALWLVLAMASGFNLANAGLILNVGADGKLTGASNVNVNDVLYDVAFVDDACGAVYGSCAPNTQFTFTTYEEGEVAFRALLAAMISAAPLYDFVTDASSIFGLETITENQYILTPYYIDRYYRSEFNVLYWGNCPAVCYGNVRSNDVASVNFYIPVQSTPQAGLSATWALWTAVNVPEPSTVAILALALLGIGVRRNVRA